MNAYEDPEAMANALDAAANSAESEGRDYQEVGLVLLRAAARLLRLTVEQRASRELADVVFANPELRARFEMIAKDTATREPVPDDFLWLPAATQQRPPHPDREIPDGWQWEAVPEDSTWRVRPGAGRCRSIDHEIRCPATGVVQINRSRNARKTPPGEQWWSYCADHLYGRWIEGNKVMVWRCMGSPPDSTGERDRLAEDWLIARHPADWYIGSAITADWLDAYQAVDKATER